MNTQQWRAICACYNLGEPTQPPQAVTGGMRHALYRAEAGTGVYAVKVLSPSLVANAAQRAEIAQAETLAQQMAEAGLPAACALPGPNGPLLTVEGGTVVVFAWREGKTLPPAPASAEEAEQIGTLLGRIHTLAPRASDAVATEADGTTPAQWTALVETLQREQAPGADALYDALPEIVRWQAGASNALAHLGGERLLTHRDLDQKNVLWSGSRAPWLLDWEGAGPMPPALEVMGTALNWAGQAAGTPEEEPFRAFVRGYRQARTVPADALAWASRAVPDKWLVWLKFNAERLRADTMVGPAEWEMACGAVGHCLVTLRTMEREAGRREAWCGEG